VTKRCLLFLITLSLCLCGASYAADPILWFKGAGDRCEGSWLAGFSADVLATVPPAECDAIVKTHADNGYIRVMRILTRNPAYGGEVTLGRAVSSDIKVAGIKCRFIYIRDTFMAFLVVGGNPYLIDLRAAEIKYGVKW